MFIVFLPLDYKIITVTVTQNLCIEAFAFSLVIFNDIICFHTCIEFKAKKSRKIYMHRESLVVMDLVQRTKIETENKSYKVKKLSTIPEFKFKIWF